MNQEKTTLEIIAPTTEEAIAKGLDQLGLSNDAVDVEVLDSGSKGLLGLGSRLARVRLTVKSEEKAAPLPSAVPEYEEELEEETGADFEALNLSEEDEKALKTTRSVVRELLERMRIKADIQVRFVEPSDENDQRVVMVDIRGNDLSILIGRQSETINALQYISSLIVCKELGYWVPIMIDVQGYRQRRERQLRQLGRKMAEQAIQTGRRQVLEPMPANERRLIHLELRNNPLVMTESVGEEPYRKITISLKKNQDKRS